MVEATLKESYRQLVATWDAIVPERKDALVDEFLLGYAFNSGHIENDLITLHDTREVFENGRVVSFTGDIRTLFEIQNLKTSWEWGRAQAVPGLLFDEATALQAHLLLTQGTYDERRWNRGERPGSYKLGEYVVGRRRSERRRRMYPPVCANCSMR